MLPADTDMALVHNFLRNKTKKGSEYFFVVLVQHKLQLGFGGSEPAQMYPVFKPFIDLNFFCEIFHFRTMTQNAQSRFFLSLGPCASTLLRQTLEPPMDYP